MIVAASVRIGALVKQTAVGVLYALSAVFMSVLTFKMRRVIIPSTNQISPR